MILNRATNGTPTIDGILGSRIQLYGITTKLIMAIRINAGITYMAAKPLRKIVARTAEPTRMSMNAHMMLGCDCWFWQYGSPVGQVMAKVCVPRVNVELIFVEIVRGAIYAPRMLVYPNM
jgi:hypothetical protein